jgi:hypothetical protein
MPISFACASGEENRDAQCQMRCKNGFALCVGVRLSTQEAPRCISMNSRLTTFYLNQKIKQGFFLYYISCNENNVGKFLKLRENCYFIILSYSHPEIGNFRVRQSSKPCGSVG